MIELKDLHKVVDQQTVIDIELLEVKLGEIAALVGPVDSGKDTLLELLTGKSQPTSGTLRLGNIDPHADRDAFSRTVGVVFSEENLYNRQTPTANLQFFTRLYRLPKSRVGEVLAQVGLADNANTKTEDLSSSFKRRLALGRAILHNPSVLLLVEPFRKCDQASVSLMVKVIRQKAEEGAAVLVIAEDMTNLAAFCDMIYRLDKGQIVEGFKPEEGGEPQFPFMVPAKLEGKVALVAPADILYAVAQDDKAYLQTIEAQLPTQFTLAELEKRLSRSGFFRAHRGYLVNLQHVKEVIPYTRDSYTLRLKDEAGTEIPLSKTAARELRELLGY
jgi:ABC-2 type transport system ATP-binding protein